MVTASTMYRLRKTPEANLHHHGEHKRTAPVVDSLEWLTAASNIRETLAD